MSKSPICVEYREVQGVLFTHCILLCILPLFPVFALSYAKHVPDLQYLSIGCTDVKSISTFSSNYGCHHERPYFRVLFKIDIERCTMTGAPQACFLRNLNKLKTFVKGINQLKNICLWVKI